MKNSTLLAIDLAKTHFQVCKLLPDDTEHSNKQIGRAALTKLLSTHKPALVAMESCGGAHHWARLAKSFGHTVKLIHPKAVKGLLVGQKTDKNDAFAIAIAARMAHLRSCAILTPENQGANKGGRSQLTRNRRDTHVGARVGCERSCDLRHQG
ncbi:IS110 family transposase [Shewanella woodyi]|uniref:IS110 family transposase n=1 Tax=Shewanella woodyi TaxID=60961 RepID=UPI00374A7D2E